MSKVHWLSQHNKNRHRLITALSLIFITLMTGCAKEIEPLVVDVEIIDEPIRDCTDQNPLKNPYFGDTHVHTTYSVDAYSQDVRVTPADAYAFAQGQSIDLPPYDANGIALRTTQLERPLDFTMVSDHAEFFGDRSLCTNPNSLVYSTATCKTYRDKGLLTALFTALLSTQPGKTIRMPHCGFLGLNCRDHGITLWQQTQIAAEQAYDRSEDCSFTSFIGYEWTGSPLTTGGEPLAVQNLHRNVMFKNAHVPTLPTSYLDASFPEGLWDRLEESCLNLETVGTESCDVLTIPHNSNVSVSLMFEQRDREGNPIDVDYSMRRARFEPIAEIVQHKGTSECIAGGNDESCAFEALPWNHLAGNLGLSILANNPPIESAFLRDALKEGIGLKQSLGENPFKYGFIGSTDTHLGTPGLVSEKDYPGHGGAAGFGQAQDVAATTFSDNVEHNPGGLAVVWAKQNTRHDLFEAMQNKEVYATSGPRHILRFFGGWDFDLDACEQGDMIAMAYDNGVPMGGSLSSPTSSAPRFIVSALKDSGTQQNPGNDLQKVQIIKGWIDSQGTRHEEIIDVAGSNNNSGVDLDTCETIGTGSAALCTVWQDNNFNAADDAFYYARVIENPSCRWTQHQCNAAGVNCGIPSSVPEGLTACCSDNIPKTIQERSWSSPIWYEP